MNAPAGVGPGRSFDFWERHGSNARSVLRTFSVAVRGERVTSFATANGRGGSFINLIEPDLRVATRCETTGRNVLGSVRLASIRSS